MELHASLLGKLERVAQQINKNLPQSSRVPFDNVIEISGSRYRKFEAFLLGCRGKKCFQGIEGVTKTEDFRVDLKLARLQLGEIQNVINDHQQVCRGLLNGPEVGLLALINLGLLEHRHHPQHAVHGCAYLMGHIGQKHRF